MVNDYISYEAMVAGRNAAEWAGWSTVVAFGSLLVSLLTLGVACKAYGVWKKQEILKIKMEFKKALMAFKTECYNSPELFNLSKAQYGQAYIDSQGNLTTNDKSAALEAIKFNNFNHAFLKCCDAWVATEHLFSSTDIEKGWNDVCELARKYVEGSATRAELQSIINELYSKNFVFT